MLTVAKTKISVMPASRMLSAISFGVFCRTAPSTSAIMRSRKVEPCAAVMRTLSQSEVTRVPPVTAERSPPLSRMTGADSPVIADSSTEATPSMTSPSLGMMSPVSTRTRSPGLSVAATACIHCRSCAVVRRVARVSVRVRRSVSAWALPRPSAMASAKLANSTVNHSHNVIWPEKRACRPMTLLPPMTRSRTKKIVVSTETISTQNITGFFTSVRGSSLRKAPHTAGTSSARSSSAIGCRLRLKTRLLGGSETIGEMLVMMVVPRETCCSRARIGRALGHRDLLDHRPESDGGEIGEPADDEDDADQQADEERPLGREGAGRRRQELLLRQRPGDREQGDHEDEPAHEHRRRQRRIVEEGVGGDAGERAAVVAGGRGEGVEDLAEAVRPGIGDAREPGRHNRRQRGPSEDRQRQGEERQDGHLDLLALELLAEIFGRAPDHQSGDEHGDDGEGEDAVEAGADAAEDDLAELDIDQRHHAAERHEAVMHGIDRAAGGVGGDGGEERAVGDAETHLLAFHVAAGLGGA